MRVLPDTSIWVDYLRAGSQGDAWVLDALLEQGEVVVCGPVIAELLAGAGPTDRSRLWALMRALPWSELDREAWGQTGEVAARLREAGTPAALTDIEIAVAAVDAGATLWTRDQDFDQICDVIPELELFEA